MALKAPNLFGFGIMVSLVDGIWGLNVVGIDRTKASKKKWRGFTYPHNGCCFCTGRGTLLRDDEASSSMELRSAGGSLDGKWMKDMTTLPRCIPGAYSEAAALNAYPLCEAVPCEQFEAAFKAVELWLVDRAVLPIENSLGGSIHRNYDLLLDHRLHIVGEVQLNVNHCLLGLPDVRKEEINRVLSHPQALDQCEFTLSNLGVVRESTDDTVGAAQISIIVAAKGLRDTGAVASARAGEIYGLHILAEKIQDDLDNVTRFLVLAREPIIPGT